MLINFKGIAHLEMAKSHVFVLMQITYLYIVWNFPKFQEHPASSFWDMRQRMCIIIVVWGGAHRLDRYPFMKMRKSQEQYPY